MRRPVFWFLWPAPEPGPVDADAVQSRWMRVCGRGPWRWAFLIACTALVVTVISAAVAATLDRPSWATAALSILVAVPLIAMLARAWVAGTYLSDRGIKVSRVLTTEVLPWPVVADVSARDRSRWLGTPLLLPGRRIAVLANDGTGSAIDTHVQTASPDLWLRPQSFEAAHDRLRTWLRETR